ncbi:MAG: quinoprotein dehydrogenase-associated putative ABC transporter substrate-binding protein [Methylococcales symbiont of Hymedesmia sp. n. MRB-2018]|nr:MAG: quinoprotein dehydrogenase-associated putative ABC transporter substrate-binding protein [Methylococcales symbiont of Hymedesmia sp. n. MRB-2018]
MKSPSIQNKLLFTLLFASFSFNSFAAEKFRVCADPLHPPYSTKAQDGFENKIATLFAKKLSQELEYYWFPQRIGFVRNTLKSQIDNTEQYKCDVIMGLPVGFDFAKTTKPYYHSSYVLLIAKGRGWDDITQSSQLSNLSLQREESLKIAMFDRGPGTTWLQKQGLLDQGIPYQTMTGDDKNNVAMQIEKDLKAEIIDMVILWGPMAGHVVSQSPKDSYHLIPMQSTADMKFDFSMAMGIRYGDNKRKDLLESLIDKNKEKIQWIISEYNIPLLPIPEQKIRDDDD